MPENPERDFFQTVVISGIRHPAMVAGLVAGLLSGGFVAGTGWTLMQAEITHLGSKVSVSDREIRIELKRIEGEMRAAASARDIRMERLSNDIAEMKASIRGIDTAIQFLVHHQRQQTRNNSGTIPRQ